MTTPLIRCIEDVVVQLRVSGAMPGHVYVPARMFFETRGGDMPDRLIGTLIHTPLPSISG